MKIQEKDLQEGPLPNYREKAVSTQGPFFSFLRGASEAGNTKNDSQDPNGPTYKLHKRFQVLITVL